MGNEWNGFIVVLLVPVGMVIVCWLVFVIIDVLKIIINRKEWIEFRAKIEIKEKRLISLENELKQKEIQLNLLEKDLTERQQKLNAEINSRLGDIDMIMNSRLQSFPFLARLFADYNYIKENDTAYLLAHKKPRPALKASEELKRIAKEKRALEKQCKAYEYQLHFYETCFPNLEEFKEIQPNEAYKYCIENSSDDAYEYYREWLNPQEFAELSDAQKLQLKFERYLKRKNKNSWDIGIEYERYIGYKYEVNGYKVHYEGALKKLDDRGRDIIVEREDDILVIQCKRWAKEKTIHEKHIMQLFGSVTLLNMENEKNYKGVFITTAKLSETAKYFAERLDIQVVENYSYKDYPLIKCNISPEGEKIYHLPFDQQYDRIHIDLQKGNCYVSTIAEAEEKGFRHAYRWSGNK